MGSADGVPARRWKILAFCAMRFARRASASSKRSREGIVKYAKPVGVIAVCSPSPIRW